MQFQRVQNAAGIVINLTKTFVTVIALYPAGVEFFCAEIMVGNGGSFGYNHLIVNIFHNNAFARVVRQGKMMRIIDVRVHVNTAEQFDCLINVSGFFKKISKGSSSCEGRFAGVLMGFNVVARNKVGNGKAFFVDTVKRDKKSAQRHILILKSFRQISLAETVKRYVKRRNVFVTVCRKSVKHNAGA